MKRGLDGRIVLSIAAVLFAGWFAAKTASGQSAAAPTPIKASAIQIQQIQSEDVKLPAEFQMSMYEHVVEEVTKTKRFQHVYRDGDKGAADAPDLVTLQCTVTGFKQGSAMERQVTTSAAQYPSTAIQPLSVRQIKPIVKVRHMFSQAAAQAGASKQNSSTTVLARILIISAIQ